MKGEQLICEGIYSFKVQKKETDMEGEVCIYQKYGYCKYKESCKNKHLEETCQQRSACLNQKSCHRRHPRGCKRYGVEGYCRFGAGCAYHHQEQPSPSEKVVDTEVKMKLENLEKTVVEMAEKITKLECKMQEMEVIKNNEPVKIPDDDKALNKNDKPKDSKARKGNLKEKKVSVFKFGADARKAVPNKIEIQEEKNSKEVKCELCDYRCEKVATLKKHINSTHTKHKCKICGEEFDTSMALLSHVAIEHNKEDDILNGILHSTPKDKENKESSFDSSDVMLNKYLK